MIKRSVDNSARRRSSKKKISSAISWNLWAQVQVQLKKNSRGMISSRLLCIRSREKILTLLTKKSLTMTKVKKKNKFKSKRHKSNCKLTKQIRWSMIDVCSSWICHTRLPRKSLGTILASTARLKKSKFLSENMEKEYRLELVLFVLLLANQRYRRSQN